jgi:transposase
MATKVRLTHAERRERRKQIATYMRQGKTLGEAAKKFDVTTKTVRDSCQEHGVSLTTVIVAAS